MPDIVVDEKLLNFLMFLPFFFLSITIHEFAHGYTASKFGDNTAKDLGRLTLNPVKHIDLVGTVILPLMSFLSGFILIGWAKPVPVDRRNFRDPIKDDLYVSAAGPVSNFALAIALFLFVLLFQAVGITSETAVQMIWYGIYLNIFLCLFNLLPIPPLDGSHILFDLFPNKLTAGLLRAGFMGMFLLLMFIWSPLWDYFLSVINAVFGIFMDLSEGMVF